MGPDGMVRKTLLSAAIVGTVVREETAVSSAKITALNLTEDLVAPLLAKGIR
jgi:hypothetical protein